MYNNNIKKFCASISIVVEKLLKKDKLLAGDKIILLSCCEG